MYIPVLVFASAFLFLIGIGLPLLRVEKMLFWNSEYSVLSGTLGLWHDKEYFLSAILFVFSVLFPFIKFTMLLALWFGRFGQEELARGLHWLGILGKWSMLDVFIAAILIVAVKLGPLANVYPQSGVYVFCVAILGSILATTFVERLVKKGSY